MDPCTASLTLQFEVWEQMCNWHGINCIKRPWICWMWREYLEFTGNIFPSTAFINRLNLKLIWVRVRIHFGINKLLTFHSSFPFKFAVSSFKSPVQIKPNKRDFMCVCIFLCTPYTVGVSSLFLFMLINILRRCIHDVMFGRVWVCERFILFLARRSHIFDKSLCK